MLSHALRRALRSVEELSSQYVSLILGFKGEDQEEEILCPRIRTDSLQDSTAVAWCATSKDCFIIGYPADYAG